MYSLKTEVFNGPADWASKKYTLTDSFITGKYNASYTPYLLPIFDAFEDPNIREITIVCGSQMAKTMFLMVICGYTLAVKPKPILFIEPTQQLAHSMSKDRFSRMAISVGLTETGKRESIDIKRYNGTEMVFAWASSPNKLCGFPASIVCLDEVDRMPHDIKGEGSPIGLARGRVLTYPDHKIIIASTPTTSGVSQSWKNYTQSTQMAWHIQCEFCGQYTHPVMNKLKYTADRKGICNECYLECNHCKGKILNTASANGKYIEICEGPPEKVGFHISGMASPFRNLKQLASRLIRAKLDGEESVKTVCNVDFGEVYEGSGEVVSEERLSQLLERPPEKAEYTTMGVDIQKEAIYFALRSWWTDEDGEHHSWSKAYNKLIGSTDQPDVWRILERAIASYRPNVCLIDSGFRTDIVYRFCDTHKGICHPVRGSQAPKQVVKACSRIERAIGKGVLHKSNEKYFLIDDGYFKSKYISMITKGVFHILPDSNEDYRQQLTNEEQVVDKHGHLVWRERGANHYLDCEKMNVFAYDHYYTCTTLQPSSGISVLKQGANIWTT